MKTGSNRAPTALAALSHEFRTPLNAVLGMTRLLEGTRLTAEQRAYVTALRQGGDHLLSLVNDILDLARLDAGSAALSPAPMRMAKLLQEVTELLSPKAHEKGLDIAWAAPSDIPPILADEGRLRQVLFNLAGNAIKFTEEGGVFLTCSVRPAGQGRVRLRLIVRDTGPGVSPEVREQIFQAFAHAEDRDGRRSDSAGLGLAIVRRLAETHRGDAGVISEPGQGAEFWFEADFAAASRPDPRRPLAGLSVGVISPSSTVREAAAIQLAAAGAEAIVSETLSEGVSRTPKGCVVLLDQSLWSGKKPPKPLADHPSLILLPPELRKRITPSRTAGFAGYLIKPLRQVSVVERVLAALGRVGADAPAAADERASVAAGRGARVLLVEDNPVNALLARKLLEREGCAVDQAASAEQAHQRIEEGGRFDLILMDRRLPGEDGLSATRRLRAAGVAAPIVALTADAFEEDRRACLAAGMDDFLTKPLDPDALRALLARMLSDRWTNRSEDAKLAS